MRRTLTLVLIAALDAGPAYAQSPHIGAAAVADIARFSGPTDDALRGNGNGDAFGWLVRAGTPIGDRWGLDIEFTRGGRIKSDTTIPLSRLLETLPQNVVTGNSFSFSSSSLSSSFAPQFGLSQREQISTISPSVWFRHELTPRFSLRYLGGIAFVRAEQESRFLGPSFLCPDPPPGGFPFPVLCRDTIDIRVSESVSYSAAPSVGIDLTVGLTDHLSIVPSARLLALDLDSRRGWLTRPAVGVEWSF